MWRQTVLWILIAKLLVSHATEALIAANSSRDFVTISMEDSQRRLRCPDSERRPVIVKAWYGLSNLMDVDCRYLNLHVSYWRVSIAPR